MRYRLSFYILPIILGFISNLGTITVTNASEQAWNAFINGEAIAIMRHAYAPDTNETSVFDSERCAGQRNLSAAGVNQAKNIMATIKENGVQNLQLFSSSLCRCIDTGKAFNSGDVQYLNEIDTYYNAREKGPAQTDALKKWIMNAIKENNEGDKPTMLITHGLNINDLLSVYAEQGDVLLLSVKNDQLIVLHQFSTEL